MSDHPSRGGDSFPETAPRTAEHYKQAGKSQNTEKAYSQAVDHYRDECHGKLPASEEMIEDYIAKCAQHYSVSTIKLRLAGLSNWHTKHGFPDLTKAKSVKAVLRGISKTHNKPQSQALPVAFDHLQQMVRQQELLMLEARAKGDIGAYKRGSRDVALLLIGFWRGFRSDELSRLEVQHITVYKGSHLDIYLPYSKTDGDAAGRSFTATALKALCPVQAYCRWVEDAGIAKGPVFRAIDRWGNFAEKGITGKSIGPILNGMAEAAGINNVHYSTHSLRRGFAKWAADSGWDVHSTMEYVGWKNYENAKRYIPPRHSFGVLALDNTMSSLSRSSVPTALDATTVVAEGANHRDN